MNADAIDFKALLEPISLQHPCGLIDPYDLRLQKLNELLQSKLDPESPREVVYLPTDWKEVEQKARLLFREAIHLRPATALAECAMHKDGVRGLLAGVSFVADLCERFWEGLHPNDGEESAKEDRVPIMEQWNTAAFILGIQNLALTKSRIGTFSYQHLQECRTTDSDPEKADRARTIQAAFRDTPQDELRLQSSAIEESVEAANRIVKAFETLGGGVNLEALIGALKKMSKAIAPFLGNEESSPEVETDPAAASGSIGASSAGPPRTRQAAMSALDGVIDYFRKHEPSSPIPFFLERAKKLSGKDFLESLEYLTNDKSAASQVLVGYPPPDQTTQSS